MPVMPPHGIPPEPAWLRSRTMPLIAALALACISAFAVTVVAASMDFLKTVSAVPSTMSVTAMETISSTRVNPRFVRLRCKFSSVVAGNGLQRLARLLLGDQILLRILGSRHRGAEQRQQAQQANEHDHHGDHHFQQREPALAPPL